MRIGEYLHIYQGDCMDFMKNVDDNFYNLAIVDPPYGIGISSNPFRKRQKKKSWDNEIPKKEYFDQLMKVSKNQIIWGGNYFDLGVTQNYIVWDKKQPEDFSSAMAEIAWSSIQMPIKIFRKHVVTAEPNKIHPTQKPVALYKWLLKNYAKEGDLILDTHLGSGSSAIAAHDMKFNFTGIELDKEYYDSAVKRIKQHTAQTSLF